MAIRLPHPGTLVAFAIVALVAGSFITLASVGGGRAELFSIGPYLRNVLTFSVVQAILSTLLSLALGIGLALALARRRFWGRGIVLSVLGTTMVIPTIVAVFAVFAVYGRSGWLAQFVTLLGIAEDFSIFGYPGILIAHVFLNAPFIARVMLDALNLVPAEQWRLASALGFSPGQIFRHLDWPVLRAEIPGLASLIFLLCFKSFAIVLALGGGPSRATLEVAIYEALKIDLDFSRAAWLALIQLGICLSITAILHWAFKRPPVSDTLRAPIMRPDRDNRRLFVADAIILTIGALFIGSLIFSILMGITHLPAVLDADLAQAFATSLVIAIVAASFACLLAIMLGAAARYWRLARNASRVAMLYDFLPNVLLAVPPFALTAGLFLIVRPFVDPAAAGVILLPLVNGLTALPFAYRYIGPRLLVAEERYGHLASMLGMKGLTKLEIMDWPLLRRPFGAAFALTMALSFGDFGIIALFGGTELRTLPYLLYERLGAYRLEEASAIGLIILLAAFLLAHLSGRLSHASD